MFYVEKYTVAFADEGPKGSADIMVSLSNIDNDL